MELFIMKMKFSFFLVFLFQFSNCFFFNNKKLYGPKFLKIRTKNNTNLGFGLKMLVIKCETEEAFARINSYTFSKVLAEKKILENVMIWEIDLIDNIELNLEVPNVSCDGIIVLFNMFEKDKPSKIIIPNIDTDQMFFALIETESIFAKIIPKSGQILLLEEGI